MCFGGIQGFCAVLRRELIWGNLFLVVFGFLGGGSRGVSEEGGPTSWLWVVLGNGWGDLNVRNGDVCLGQDRGEDLP
jgi:hypothetical protein